MRLAYPRIFWALAIVGCGTSTPAGETDADSTSSSTVIVTSNDGENTTVPMTTLETSLGSEGSSTPTSTSTEPTETSTDETSTDSTTSGGSSSSGSDSGTDSTGSESSGTGGEAAPCTAGCMTQLECTAVWKNLEACVTACEDNLIQAALFSQFCEIAWENLSACFGTLTCDEYAEYLEAVTFPYPCDLESDALSWECKGQGQ